MKVNFAILATVQAARRAPVVREAGGRQGAGLPHGAVEIDAVHC